MATTGSLAFGDLLRRYRRLAGLTQEALAERAHLSTRAIRALELGINRAPRAATLALLVEALALSAEARAALVAAAQLDTRAARQEAERTAPQWETAPPLVGRTQGLALLATHLAGGGPPVLLLAGEPGIGKSRLLQHAARQAPAAGWRVLVGGCQRGGGQEPYAPLLSAIKRCVGSRTPAQLRADLQGCAWLVRLLPELADGPIEPLPAWTVPPEQERRLMVEAVLRFLTNSAGPAGTLLVLDDLQWAGPDALTLLTSVARFGAESPLRVLGAYRDTEAPPGGPLADLLADLAHAALATHHRLEPLQPEDAETLLSALLGNEGAAFREHVVRRAGGVPFFLVSCAQAVRAGALEHTGADAVPWTVAQGIRQRLAALPQATRAVLGVAAVLGRAVEPTVLTAVDARPEEEVIVALEAASQARLLAEDEHGYHFAHDMIREVVEAEVGVARRQMVHRRIAAVIEQEPGERPVEALAYHYSRGGVADKAELYLEQAGDRARLRAADAAATGYYTDLVERLDALGRSQDSARAREKLGGVLVTAGRYDDAVSVLELASAAHRAAQDLDSAGRVMAQAGLAYWAGGRSVEGLARLRSLLEMLLAQGPSPGLAALSNVWARLLSSTGRYDELPAAAARAADLARTVGDEHLLGRSATLRLATLVKAAPAGSAGHMDRAWRLVEEEARSAEAVGDLRRLFANLHDRAYLHVISGEFDTGRQLYQRAVLIAEQMRDPNLAAFVMALRGWSAFLRGEWGEARGTIAQAVALGRELGRPWATPYTLLHLGQLCLAEGELDEAARWLEEAVALAEQASDLQGLRQASGLLAECEILVGRPDSAQRRLAPLLDRPGLEEYDATALLPTLAWAHLEVGATEQAEREVTEAIRRTRPEQLRLVLVDALRVQALVAMCRQQWAEARRSLEEALSVARSMPYPYAEARLLHVAGLLHLRRGELQPAQEQLVEARTIFQRLGAGREAEQYERALAGLPRP
jgi:tetratricopeptide (TPR) repeat protein/transcriptional regulator with XRE-family HTH domain